MRKGHLTFNDLVNVSVITSSVENQEIAERMAAEILVNVNPDEELPDPSPDGNDFLNLLQKATENDMEVTPFAKGLENELGMAADETAPDQFANQILVLVQVRTRLSRPVSNTSKISVKRKQKRCLWSS